MLDYFLGSCGNLYRQGTLRRTQARRTAHQTERACRQAATRQLRAGAARKRHAAQDVHPHQRRLARPRRRSPARHARRAAAHARRRNRHASALARWLVSPDHPLTSRVAVNRIWQELFGRGIVFTSDDFGTQGDRPTHPELLDWLASEFMQRGWSMKQMVRLLVTSATYRQSSNARPELAAKDPENTLLARQSRLRLPAELIRDEALYAGGLLDLRIGGTSVSPRSPKASPSSPTRASVKWEESTGAGSLPPRPLHPLPAHRAVSATDELRRAVRQPLLHAPRAHRHAAAGAQPDERSGLLRSRPGTRLPHHARDHARRLPRPSQLRLRHHARPPAFGATKPSAWASISTRPAATSRPDPQTVAALFPNRLEGVPQAEAAAWVELSRVLLNLDEFITERLVMDREHFRRIQSRRKFLPRLRRWHRHHRAGAAAGARRPRRRASSRTPWRRANRTSPPRPRTSSSCSWRAAPARSISSTPSPSCRSGTASRCPPS